MTHRLNKERQEKLEPSRMQFIKSALEKRGIKIVHESKAQIKFMYKGHKVTFYPYSGWASGATITDGRGVKKITKTT